MSKALSLDLRVRVLAAVHAGASHRETAERFGVSAASVSRWRTREREQGEARPKALGGDRRSKRIEACHDAVMAALGPDKDATIEEVRQALGAQGLVFGFGTIQRFFVRHAITRKKRPRTPPSRIARTSPSGVKPGSRGNSTSIPSG
jgi:transposase